MKLVNLEAFIAVAETGSISRAAMRLHVTQSAISRRLKNLEASVKTPLVDRRVRPPRITAAGMRLIEQGRKVMHAISELTASESDDAPAGQLNLGVAPGIAETILGSPLDAILREFPQVKLNVRSGWSNALVELVRTGELDIAAAVLTEPLSALPDLSMRAMATDTVVVVASAARKLASSPSLNALSALPWVLNPKGCSFRRKLERAFVRAGLPLHICAEVPGYEMQMSLVSRGVGLALVPLSGVRSSQYRRLLRQLDVPALQLSVTSALLWPTSQTRFLPLLQVFHERFKAAEHQYAQAA